MLGLLDDVLRECDADFDYEPVLDAALDEMELLRRENLLTFNVQMPKRISPHQPVANESVLISMNTADSPHFDFRDELAQDMGRANDDGDQPGYVPQLVSLRDHRTVVDDETHVNPTWWGMFCTLRTDSVPWSVQAVLRKEDGKRPRKEFWDDGTPRIPARPTMRELLLWQRLQREHEASLAPLTEDALFLAYETRGRESARAFFERLQSQDRLPERIASQRTFERRYGAWKASSRL